MLRAMPQAEKSAAANLAKHRLATKWRSRRSTGQTTASCQLIPPKQAQQAVLIVLMVALAASAPWSSMMQESYGQGFSPRSQVLPPWPLAKKMHSQLAQLDGVHVTDVADVAETQVEAERGGSGAWPQPQAQQSAERARAWPQAQQRLVIQRLRHTIVSLPGFAGFAYPPLQTMEETHPYCCALRPQKPQKPTCHGLCRLQCHGGSCRCCLWAAKAW